MEAVRGLQIVMHSVISILTKSNLAREIQAILPILKLHVVNCPATDEQLRRSHIVISDFDLISPYIYDLPNAQWLQGTWAGVETFFKNLKPNQPPSYVVTRFSGKHFGSLMTEYVIANILNQERAFFEIKENQKKREWIQIGQIYEHRSLRDLTVGIMGLGNIGNRIAHNLNFLGANVVGFGRKPCLEMQNYKHIFEYYSLPSMASFLHKCDYIVNVLPSTEETKGMLNDIFENCKGRNTIFINIGRGSIISETCLVEALENKWIAGAILDVHENEPLAQESKLWEMENVFITPHVSGVSRAKDIAEHFVDNYRLYQQNLPLLSQVDFTKGY